MKKDQTQVVWAAKNGLSPEKVTPLVKGSGASLEEGGKFLLFLFLLCLTVWGFAVFFSLGGE